MSIHDLKQKYNFYENGVFRFKYIKTMDKGKHFGELGILENQPRTATIVCSRDCSLGKIEKA